MKLGIVGLPNVGKSTLFNAITNAGAESANYPFCTIDPNVGVVAVPDSRLTWLSELYHPKKTTPAVIEFVDIAGLVKGASKGAGLGNQFLGNIRATDAIVHVVRCFDDDNIMHVVENANEPVPVDPAGDIATIDLELIMADLEMVERRIKKAETAAKGDKKFLKEAELFTRLKDWLNEGHSARSFECDEDESAVIATSELLSLKSIIYAANLDEEGFSAVFIGSGAGLPKFMGIPGENANGVFSANEYLTRSNLMKAFRDDYDTPISTNKKVVVVGGGNVAMDVTRSAIRLGAEKVTCVYRRRQEDMTAQMEEVEGAVAEGAEVLTLQAPLRIEADENGHVAALWTQPQIIGEMDKAGRPRPNTADVEPLRIPADTIIVAIGQGIETRGLEQTGIKIQRGGALLADSSTQLPDMVGVFAGGDCVTGPATVIRAIAAGKAAAANIDEYLGFNHEIEAEVKVPTPRCTDLRPRGRVNATERDACERKGDFQCIECGMTDEEAGQESSRCLRCDHFGYGIFKGGRVEKW